MSSAVLILCLSFVTLGGCSGGDSHSDFASAAKSSVGTAGLAAPRMFARSETRGADSVQAQAASGGAPSQILTPRQVITSAQLTIRVNDLDKSEQDATTILTRTGGYVESAASTDLVGEHPSLRISYRIPSQKFQAAIKEFEGLGIRLAKSIASEDVTGQIVDLDARLKTLTAEEEAYRQILRQQRQVSGLLEVQRSLTEVRTQIEQITGQRKSLLGQAAMSNLQLTMEKSASNVALARDSNWMGQAFGESSSSLISGFRTAAVAGIWFVVFSPVWVPILFLAYRVLKPHDRRVARVSTE